jgi:hypothetical protein
MANMFLYSILVKFINSSERHQANSEMIQQKLFGDSYSRLLPMRDLLLLANIITERLNQSRSDDKRQTLLAVNEPGSAMLVNCGEAVFRTLALTAKNDEQVQQNRDYAELFDALLAPEYKLFKKSHAVTIADVCARYPDASKDIVITLQSIADRDGYSAASNYFRRVKSQYNGSHVKYNRRKAGYGVIS